MKKTIVSSKNNKFPQKITFTGTLSIIDFEIMYRIKLKRICKGYSQQELSFLLGMNKEYVSVKERLESKKGYTVTDINKLAFILDYDCPSFVPLNPTKKKSNVYVGLEVRENGKIYHEISINAGISNKLLFKIEEDDPEVIEFPASEESQLVKLKTFIATLCEIGYFTELKTPFQLFLCCSRTVPGYISVRLVEQAVNYFVEEKRIKKVINEGYIAYKGI